LKVEAQKTLPIFYKDVMLDCGYRLDLVVEDQVIIEIKSVNGIAPIHEAQLLSYLRLYGTCARGLLINFNVKRLIAGRASSQPSISFLKNSGLIRTSVHQ
jgi:GxxExxY protein